MEQTDTKPDVVIAVVCVDWRLHHPDSTFAQSLYDYTGASRVYVVTYPGPDGLCDGMQCACERKSFEDIVNRTRTVMAHHGVESARKVLVVHSDCAGHTVTDNEHQKHAREIVRELNQELHPTTPFEPLMAVRQKHDLDWAIVPCT